MAVLKYQDLTAHINNNYQTAINYYQAKEDQFRKSVLNEVSSQPNNYTKRMNDIAKAFYPNVINPVENAIYGIKSIENAKSDSIYSEDVQTLYETINGKKKQLYQRSGEYFEKFLARELNTLTPGEADAISDFTAYHAGKIVNESFVVKGKKDTRVDLAFAPTSRGSLQGTQLELKSEVIINDEELKKELTSKNAIEYMEEQLGKGSSEIFGIQAKLYKNFDKHKWMTSSVLKNNLQAIYDSSLPRTWGSNYALLYAQYYLSQRIFNIASPVNIGVASLDGFIYMSNFLSKYRFYMNIAAQKTRLGATSMAAYEQASEERGGGYEIFPRVSSSEILLLAQSDGLKVPRTSKYKNEKIIISYVNKAI